MKSSKDFNTLREYDEYRIKQLKNKKRKKVKKKNVDPRFIHESSINETYNIRRRKFSNDKYKEYLKSDEWAWKKSKWLKRKDFKTCKKKGCKIRHIELHHISYKRVGTIHEGKDVIPLCRKHHQQVHDISKETGLSVRLATNMVIYNKH